VWSTTIDGIARTRSAPHPTDGLESVLELLYDEAVTQPPNTRRLFAAIGRLLRYHGSVEGHTHDNLWVTSYGVANFIVDNVDALYEEFRGAALEVELVPTDQSWGNREMYLTDPDGNSLRFVAAGGA
jgi:catechol 2,3-dioxygenase-like lactoylglutathione lyase family enzyme